MVANSHIAKSLIHQTNVRRLLGLAAVVLLVGLFGRSSSAEFESPFIDTTNGSNNVEFRSVWAFDRGFDNGSGTQYNRYEAFAVGVDTTITACPAPSTDKSNCNGAIYFFDGTKWSRVATPMQNGAPAYSLNGVVGQTDGAYGTLDKLWIIGPGGRVQAALNIAGTTYNGVLGLNNFFSGTSQKLIGTSPTPLSALDTIDLYAIDAVNDFGGRMIIGGQGGTIVKNDAGSGYDWRIVSGVLNIPGNTESVTGIRFITATEAYVTTTVFSNDPTTSKPYTPFDHNCSAGNGNIGYLYKVDLTTPGNGSWTRIRTETGNCFYGLTGTLDDNFQPVVWVASEKGLYKCGLITTACGTWVVGDGTQNKPQYSAVAINQRAGTGTNLLRNGDYSLNKAGWTQLGSGITRLYRTSVGGPCTTENQAQEVQINTAGDVDGGSSNPYLKVTNRAIIKPGCVQKWPDGFTTGAYQTIPTTTLEGQRFKISGDYKVEFPTYVDPVPTKAQGGVVLTCGGSNVQIDPRFVDCSVSNRKFVRTAGNPTSGWEHFEMIVSREDGIFNSINVGYNTYLTKRKMDLQVRCEATYGATVSCDNLKVEPIDTPSTVAQSGVTVITAGKNLAENGIAINENALNSNTFRSEAVPSKVRLDRNAVPPIYDQINSMFALGTQHIYAAGQGYINNDTAQPVGLAIFGRTPSTLTGSIWAGAYSPINATDNAPTGLISVSCVDDRGVDDSQPSLCQRVPESYGMSLEITSAYSATKTGQLTGRGWFGEVLGGKSTESLDLGTCQNSLEDPDLHSNASYAANQIVTAGTVQPTLGRISSNFNLLPNGVACDYSYNTVTGAETGSRRCKKVNPDGTLSATELTNVSCLTNFDCLGRCEKDNGFVCLKDSDCKLNAQSDDDPTWVSSTTKFSAAPWARLTCGTANGSPLACTPPGWLSFNAADFISTERTPPNTLCVSGRCNDGTNRVCSTNAECFGANYNTLYTAHNSAFTEQNKGAHELSGWGRFMTLAKGQCTISGSTTVTRVKSCSTSADCTDVAGSICINNDKGWVRLRGNTIPSNQITGPFLYGCQNCDGSVATARNCAFCQDSSGHSCVPSDTNTVANCYNVCKNDPAKSCKTNAECRDASNNSTGPCITPGYCSKDPGTYCQSDGACTAGNVDRGICVIGSVCSTAGATCTAYGVNLDTTTGKFTGFAWSQDFGWLNFKNVSYGGSRILQTRLGDIYATGKIGDESVSLPPGGNSCNSTFLITSASTITGFCSASGENIVSPSGALVPTKQPDSTRIPFPTAENTYQNILGRFDLVGIEKVVKTIGTQKYNKYGSEVAPLPSTADLSTDWQTAMVSNGTPLGKTLGGKVYVVGDGTSSYNLDTDMNFNNGNAGVSGAGILIVNGNLTILSDMSYPADNASGNVTILDSSTPPRVDLRRLASLMIVVKGDLTIENTVQNIVGAYYVTGNVNTATDIGTNQYPLTVHGLMIAKQFNFLRKFAGTIENPLPSELIIYDGRLQSNPLQGMIDFASALPNSVSVAP